MTRTIIIGGGASGVLLAAHLLRAARAPVVVTLVEQREDLGAGVAYSTKDRSHLLNVRASNMSAFADDEDHFVRWLRDHAPEVAVNLPSPFFFAPRYLYRDYLASLLAPHFEQGRLRRVRATAVSLSEDTSRVSVGFADGNRRTAERVVIATGNEGPRLPRAAWRYDGWQSSPAPAIEADASVVMIGTGLTMVDWALSLLNQGHRGPITAVSPHGLLPHAHRPTRAMTLSGSDVPFGQPLGRVSAWLRREVRKAEAGGGEWRTVIDALRPHTQRLWQSLSLDDKQRFLRHGRAWWDQHRHRIAPAAAAILSTARASGQLRILPARLDRFEERNDGVDVVIKRVGGGDEERLHAKAVFECRGRASDIQRTENPILQSLLNSGQGRPDALQLGLDVTPECAIISADGEVSRSIFAVGPVTSGVFWEVTAVPDIRLQVARVARQLMS
jgi:uncharacterized NAD(P)/FAD-binding protein YdhS